MTETQTREERQAALDHFAAATQPGTQQLVSMEASTGSQMAHSQVHGAQQVAVKRDTGKVLQDLKVLAAAAGENWYYRFPVKDRRTNKTSYIEGPSIKLANDLARIYGNCEIDCRATDLGSVVLFHARFIDLETGFSLTRPFRQNKGVAKIGGADNDRREDMAFQIGASKAIRNVIVNALQTFSAYAFEEARHALIDKIATQPGYRDRVLERMAAAVDIKRVEAVLGRAVKDWTNPDLAKAVAMMTAVSDGMATLDETFPPLDEPKPADAGQVMDQFVEGEIVNDAPDAATDGASSAAADLPDDTPSSPQDDQSRRDDTAAAQPSEDYDERELIERALRLATDASVSVEDRHGALEDIRPIYRKAGRLQFTDTLFKTAHNVIDGKITVASAKGYLEGLAQ